MASVFDVAAKYAAARGAEAPADAQAAAYIADVHAGRAGVGDACRARRYCTIDDSFLRPPGSPKVCIDCGAPARSGAA